MKMFLSGSLLLLLAGCAFDLSGSASPTGHVRGTACEGRTADGTLFKGTMEPDHAGVLVCTPVKK
jgi:hypothetical protein